MLFSFISCKSNEESSTPKSLTPAVSANKFLIDGKDFSGEYVLFYETTGNALIGLYFKLEDNVLINRVYTFPYRDDLTIANYVEDVAEVTDLGDGKIMIVYDNQKSCISQDEEVVTLTGDPSKSIVLNDDGTEIRFSRLSTVDFSFDSIIVLSKSSECVTKS